MHQCNQGVFSISMNLDAILWLDFLEVEMLWLLTPNKYGRLKLRLHLLHSTIS